MQLPYVRMLILCKEAAFDLHHQAWQLLQPMTTVQVSPGAEFPFGALDLNMYCQMTEGSGMNLNAVLEMRRIEITPSTMRERPVVCWHSKPEPWQTPNGPLVAFDHVFHLKVVPFSKPGVYEFAMMHNHVQIPGSTCRLNVLGPEEVLP